MQVKNEGNSTSGWLNGFLGMVIFSGSLPATRVAVLSFDPLFLTVARASIAGLIALLLLGLFKQQRPRGDQLFSLVIVALGVVVGFPLLTALALQHVTSAHSIVFLGLLPLATAIFGVLRGGERPRPAFWLFSIIGSLLVMSFAFVQGVSASLVGDSLMLAAVVVCGLGYAEGAKLSRELGGWQVISLGAAAGITRDAGDFTDADAFIPGGYPPASLDKPGLRFAVQHVDWFYLLVSGPGPGWYCQRRTTAIAAALFWLGAGGRLTA